MRKLVYYVGVSIDGYIAGPGGEFDFYPVPDDMVTWMATDYPETFFVHSRTQLGLDTPNRHFGTVLMGRGAYQPGLDAGVASPYPHLEQYVVSTTIPEIADPEVNLVPGDPLSLVRALKKEDGLDIWLCGGGKLAGTLLPEIDELVVKSYPVVAGVGISAFTGAFSPTLFTRTTSRSFSNGSTVTWYGRA
ncbi:dihydrofolate reductase family protein [Streptosporangium saharense]|uniref:Dihydrofolate reductase n=1 Tax=Streptosporangium saharense TaxID=1706840 RepID=A0A7W7VKD5_9ACTN|nr:dihydrofolate reductase family protein [Streptosporangium saharense]MBB4913244.1 dihydrofolate reductase [Streptosporangium saharense]